MLDIPRDIKVTYSEDNCEKVIIYGIDMITGKNVVEELIVPGISKAQFKDYKIISSYEFNEDGRTIFKVRDFDPYID